METPDQEVLSKLVSALPREFDFYHLGKVKLQEAALAPLPSTFPATSEDLVPAIGFSFRGDVSGVFILKVPGGADLSIYAEMGNIIASQVATQLSDRDELDVMISSPTYLSSAGLRKLLANAPVLESRTYLHHQENTAVALSTWIIAEASGFRGLENV